MSVLGIDLAARPKKTYACVLSFEDGRLAAELHDRCDDRRLLALAERQEKVAIDAPFGWPSEFVDAIAAHRRGKPWPAQDDAAPDALREALSFRATDRVAMQTRRPLSVSTDKLGVTAMRGASLLHRWSQDEEIDRSGLGRFVEVYPAAALVRWGLAGAGYKGKDEAALGRLLAELCERLPALELSPEDRKLCATDDDAFDALVAALVGRAALLGLTSPPPSERLAQAQEEGWIHLPTRGSLPHLGQTAGSLTASPAAALAEGLAATGAAVDGAGYAKTFDDALLRQFSSATRTAVRTDLMGKGGSELIGNGTRRPKFQAAYSSAALAANAFGPFLVENEGIPIAGEIFSGETRLEVECPSGLRGTPPTLDCLVDGERILAVESKCTEPFHPHHAQFSPAYGDAMAAAHPTWRAEYQRLVEDPHRYRHLDAAQLIKHYLGLRKQFHDRPTTLAYVYWEPTNASEIAACSIHAAEIAEFSRCVSDPALKFVAVSYGHLWDDWALDTRPLWLREHVAALRRRYAVAAA